MRKLAPDNPLYGNKRPFSPITKAPTGMLDRDSDDPVRLRWQADNCDTLADFMEVLQPERHQQSVWNTQRSVQAERNACGTAACALGWAAFSHQIPGLQYGISRESKCYKTLQQAIMPFAPTINGELVDWRDAGEAFFGWTTQFTVFNNTSLSRVKVIDLLRKLAKSYREEAIAKAQD